MTATKLPRYLPPPERMPLEAAMRGNRKLTNAERLELHQTKTGSTNQSRSSQKIRP
jgi:hypothetical protein